MANTVDLPAAGGRLLMYFREICKKRAVEAERFAKENAPWTDRTGDARNMLKGSLIDDGGSLGFSVAHRKEYGRWLETANDCKYAILKPTIEHFRAEFFQKAREVFGGKRA